MRVLLPLLFALVPNLPQHQSIDGPSVHWTAPGIFDPSLPPCWALRRTRGSLCAITSDGAFWLDATSSSYAASMGEDEPGSVLLDATSWDKRSTEVWRGRDGLLHVSADIGDGWRPRPIPPELQPATDAAAPPARAVISGYGDVLVLCAYGAIFRFERGTWSRLPIQLRGRALEHRADRALLVDRLLYLSLNSFDRGELIQVDIDTGRALCASDSFPEGASCVRDLELGPDGRVYVTCGAPVMSTGGQLLVREADGWRVMLAAPVRIRPILCGFALGDGTQASIPEPSEPNWTFLALAFDAQKRPCLLTEEEGILRRGMDEHWSCITPGWWSPEMGVSDLAIEGETAVFSSHRVGVLRLNLSTLEGCRLRTP